jgi:ubiquinone/menaquinone biosynthesis C-methylase UbiE
MDDDEARLSELLHVKLAFNSPLSDDHADRLLDLLEIRPGMRIIDLGCGWGELLLRALAKSWEASGEGVDKDEVALKRGRESAARRGLSDRVRFIAADLPQYQSVADRLVCIGASHAWGGTEGALGAVQRHLVSGGKALYGDGFWRAPPPPQLVKLLGDHQQSVADLIDRAVAAGFRPLFVDTASVGEWDDFEWGTYRGLEEFALDNPSAPLASKARKRADLRRDEYLRGYRGLLGFAYLILAKP